MMKKTGLEETISTISLLLLFISTVHSQSNNFYITNFGGKADGMTDSSQALLSAWKAGCAAGGTVTIPKGRYYIGSAVSFFGPCNGATLLNVQGTLLAPADRDFLKGKAWITFNHIDRLTVSGGGIFDGQGQATWALCRKSGNCGTGVNVNLLIFQVTNSIIQDVTSLNSKDFHVTVLESAGVTFQKFTSTAPANSPNTDGLHIGRSKNINITYSTFSTGDDCISMGDGSQQVTIIGVTCGPGHGISIGSLGRYPNEQPVSGIIVKSCTISNTLNGARIKSWPALYGGSASDIHFQNIIMNNVLNPVIIDQAYCPSINACITKGASKVKISNVSFKDIRGSSATPIAVKLSCSSSFPCENVQLGDINLTYNGAAAKSQCTNINAKIVQLPMPSGC